MTNDKPIQVVHYGTAGGDVEVKFTALQQIFGPALVEDFMHMSTCTLQDRTLVYCYKNRTTRNYVNVSDDLRLWAWVQPGGEGSYGRDEPGSHGHYIPIGLHRALSSPFNNGSFFYPDLVPGRDVYAAIEQAGDAIRRSLIAAHDLPVPIEDENGADDDWVTWAEAAHAALAKCSGKVKPWRAGPVTAFDIAKARGATEAADGAVHN